MPAHTLHPLDARFIKLALVQQLLTPTQVKQAEESLQRRLKSGHPATIEQVLQEEGYLTDTECQSLWDLIAQAADTHAREQISQRREGPAADEGKGRGTGTETGPIPGEVGHLPDLGEAYQILGLIGRGGMGTVFRARQLNMDREVALKVLRGDLTSNARYIRRFIREARAAGQLDHPNLVRVYDVGEAGSGGWFMSMEYVEGRTVRHLLRREGRLNLLDSLKIAAQVASALECAHRNKIIHRDIKPDNIMITSRGVAKLCDLGLAKALDGPLQDTDTQEGSTLGTPHYMSPEQAQGQTLDERSDLFSLGATIYHMVTGRVPFEGQSALEVMLKVSTQTPTPPEQIEPLLPPPVCDLIHRLMARDPRARPKDAVAVQRELESLCRDLASGRIFAYEDRLMITPVSGRVSTRLDQIRLASVGGAALFLLFCVCIRASQRAPRVPPVEPPAWAAVAPPVASPDGVKRTSDSTVAKDPPDNRVTAPHTPDAELQVLEARLNQRPGDWPNVQTELERWLKTHDPVAPHDQPHVDALGKALTAAQTAEAEADWPRRLSAVQSFARAARFSAAQRILNGVPTHLGKALNVRIEDATKALERDANEWTSQSRARFDALQAMGHLRISGAMLEAWNDLLKRDEVPADDLRRTTLADAVEAFRQAAALRQNQDQTAAATREQVQRKLVEIRVASSRHELPAAISLCDRALAAAAGEYETAVLKAEHERLLRVQRLFQTLADVLTKHPRVISERVFRPNEATSGQIIGMDDRHLVVEVGGANNEARLPLSGITRNEMRLLIEQVFSVRKLVKDDSIGRLAYDLEDSGREARLVLYKELSAGEQIDRAWLKMVMLSEQHERRRMAARWIDEAESLYLKNRFPEALDALASARESLGTGIGEQGARDGVGARAQDLLERIAAGETLSHRFRGVCLVLLPPRARVDATVPDLSRWPWKPAAPRSVAGGLSFEDGAAETASVWKLQGNARLEWELALPDTGRGLFTLTLTAGKRFWAVRVTREDGRTTVSLESTGAAVAPWTEKRTLPKGNRMRLWLETESEQLRWGVDDRTLGSYLTELQGEWDMQLNGQGEIELNGLRAFGSVETLMPADEQAGNALLQTVLAKPVGSRLHTLREVLASPQLTLAQRSICFAAIADENRTLGLTSEADAANALALYACPWDRLPEEVRNREPAHRERQLQLECEGRLPVDLRKM